MQENTLRDKVYKGIYDDVTNGVIKQNEILTESRLAQKYGVSKAPVRDALSALCRDEILRSIPRMGYQVVPVTLKGILDAVDLRVDIETCGLYRAAGRIGEEELKRLRRIASLCMENQKNVAENWAMNYDFHTYLYSLNKNALALKQLSGLMRKSATYIAQYFLSAWGHQRERDGIYHVKIVESLEAGLLEEAVVLLKTDIESVKTEISALYGWK